MEYTDDQKERLKKIKKRFFRRGALAVFLHISWLFFANMLVAIFDQLYFHDKALGFFLTLGNAIVILSGLRNTMEEIYRDSIEETKKVIKL